MVIPTGALKRAAVPAPSKNEALALLPAKVVTTPKGVAMRMTLFFQSAIKRLPLEGAMVRW